GEGSRRSKRRPPESPRQSAGPPVRRSAPRPEPARQDETHQEHEGYRSIDLQSRVDGVPRPGRATHPPAGSSRCKTTVRKPEAPQPAELIAPALANAALVQNAKYGPGPVHSGLQTPVDSRRALSEPPPGTGLVLGRGSYSRNQMPWFFCS